MLFNLLKHQETASSTIPYSDFITMVEKGNVYNATIQGDNIKGDSAQGPYRTYSPHDPQLIGLLIEKGVKITAQPPDDSNWFQ